MSGPTIVQQAFAYADGATPQPVFGSTPTVGNLVLALFSGVANSITVGINGWTLGEELQSSPDEVAWFYRYVQSGDGTTYGKCYTSTGGNGNSVQYYEIAGSTTTGSPKDVSSLTTPASGTTTTAVPSVTTSAVNEMAFAWGGYTNFFANAPTLAGASFTQDKSNAGTWAVFCCGHLAVASAGATGSPTITWNATTSQKPGIGMLAIKSAATSTDGTGDYAPGTINLTAPVWSGSGAENVTASFAPGEIDLTAPTFSGVGGTGQTGPYAPGTVTLTPPAFAASVTAAGRAMELDVAAPAKPVTHAKAAELDIAAPVKPVTHAKASELDVSAVASPATNTHGGIAELDIAVLVYLGPCATARCQVWKITRRDGVVFAFTSLDRDVVWGDVTYKTCKSLSASASESASDLHSVGSTELTGILDDEAITDADLYSGKFDDAFVEIWVIPYDGHADDMAPFRVAAGNTGKVTRGEHNFTAEVVGPGARLQQTALVDFYTPGCRWDFGDVNCAVDADALKIAAVEVTGNVGRQLVMFTASDPGGATIWNGGTLVWLTGQNAGETCQVETVDFSAQALSLWDLAPYPPAVGDTFDLKPGCPKTKAGCNAYANYLRYGGFEDVPGPDALQSNADSLFTGNG